MLEISREESRDSALGPVPIPPAVVKVVEATGFHGVFVAEPLERGYAVTLGNPLRRVLLSSIEGTAITWVRIEGVQHEYSTIPHVKEDVVDILLNLKAVHLRALNNRPGKLRLEVHGEGRVSAGDIMSSSDFEIVNPELHIATLDSPESRLSVEMNVERGKGYVPATLVTGLPIGVLPVDAIFSPVHRVNYSVERTRVGQRTDFERLVLEVWTNGAISPMDAVRQASKDLVEHFLQFSGVSESDSADGGKPSWLLAIPASQYNIPIESLGLSARTLNCLKRASVHRVGEVLEKSLEELLHIRNFGARSLEELNQKLLEMGIQHPEFGESTVAALAGPREVEAGRPGSSAGDGEQTDDEEEQG